MDKLTQEDIDARLEDFGNWSHSSGTLQRTLNFDDFLGSMAFANKVADLAEAHQHHPDIMIRYNKVTLTLTTHDANGVTEKDFDLAKAIEAIA
jgi:4a-hydroxytetrahydrobiopterin dehydratase